MPTDLSSIAANTELQHSIWIGTGGAMLVLLQSIMSGERRVWWRLLISCFIGGAAAALAGHIFQNSSWVYAICGVAAIVAENVIFGIVKASNEFKDNPIKVFTHLWRVVMPTFGKGSDKASDTYDGQSPSTRQAAPPVTGDAPVG